MNMRKNVDYVDQAIYGPHLRGDAAKFGNSPAVNRTAVIQRMYMRVLTELACNRFTWTGLPETIDPRFLELQLFYRALAVFFKHPDNDKYLVTKASPQGSWDVADNPTSFQVVGNGFRSQTLKAVRTYRDIDNELVADDPECVPIWANYLRVPDLDIVMIYASKFAELDVTIEINSKNARRNKIVAVDENMRLSATNINRQVDEGSNFISLGESAMGAVPVALDLGIDTHAIEKLHIVKVRLWNECMGLLGINNANQDKKERLVADEVDANNEQVAANRAVALNARKDAAEQINKLYSLNIAVDYDEGVSDTADEPAKPKLEAVKKEAV